MWKKQRRRRKWTMRPQRGIQMYYVVSLVQWVYKETRRGWHVMGEFFVLFCFYFYGRVSGSHGVMFTDTPWGGRKYDNIISVMLGLSLSDIWLLDKGLVQFPIILHLFFRYNTSTHVTKQLTSVDNLLVSFFSLKIILLIIMSYNEWFG
jgi:hypothetical protein